jgi:hypothetical protein
MAHGSARGPSDTRGAIGGSSVERVARDPRSQAAHRRILCAMVARLLELGVALAAVASAGLIAMLLTAPLQPQASLALPTASASARPTAVADPIGLYLSRDPIGAGHCFALELEQRSFPSDTEAGVARALLWGRGMTGCSSRSNEIEEIEAMVSRVPSDDPDGPDGYSITFRIPAGDEGPAVDAEIAVLPPRQPNPDLLQALDVTNPGFGLVLDRVASVDPPLDPLTTPAPTVGGPTGLFLLSGPFTAEGACLAIDLTRDAYPSEPGSPGTATIRWWEAAGDNVDDPAICYSRTGEVQEATATVTAVPDVAPAPVRFHVRFSAPLPGSDVEAIELSIVAAESNRDQLRAEGIVPARSAPLIFDRVDELDPPLASPPSSPASP